MQTSPIDFQTIQAKFQEIAQQYDRHAVLQNLIADELLSRLELINIPVEQVLDLGCGTAHSLKSLSKTFPMAKLCFVDASENMLKLAKKNKPWFKKYAFIQSRAEELNYPDNYFDCVISNLMLQNCADPDQVFAQVQRVTRENGLFSFSTLGPDSFKELRSAMTAAKIAINDLAFGHLTDMHDIGDALLRSGMREPVIDVDIHTLQFDCFYNLFNELHSTGHILQNFSETEIEQIAQNYPRETADADYEITFEVVYGQTWAGDGKSKSRTPEEFQFPLENLIKRNK